MGRGAPAPRAILPAVAILPPVVSITALKGALADEWTRRSLSGRHSNKAAQREAAYRWEDCARDMAEWRTKEELRELAELWAIHAHRLLAPDDDATMQVPTEQTTVDERERVAAVYVRAAEELRALIDQLP